MVKGLEELEANIRALRDKGRRAQERALTDMGDTFEKNLVSNIPVGMRHGLEIHLVEDTKTSKPRRKQGVLETKVGLAGSASRGELPAWYAHFVDTGTIKTPPSIFSERTRQQSTPELQRIIKDHFTQELGGK